jgi:HK97 gp10 family phage protein
MSGGGGSSAGCCEGRPLMAKSKMTIQSNFPAVKKAGWETVQEAREVWLEEAQSTAEQKFESQASSRGYALQVGIEKERIGFQSARIFAVAHSERWGDDPFYLRFFEYGSVQIPAMPFIRPAARKANKAFVSTMGSHLEGKIRRKASVRRR